MNGKDTIYIDIDDEITSIIDKVHSAPNKIVALVLPKRAAMLQSSVNMKLLKRGADSAKKQVVLITSEAGLLPLAGSVGLPVAKTLQSKPEIPEAAAALDAGLDELLTVDETPPEPEFNPESAADKSVGELAQKASKSVPGRTTGRYVEPDDTINLDNDLPAAGAGTAAAEAASGKAAKKPKNKKLKVPNFSRFRKIIIIAAVVIVLLIIGWILAFIILPHATVTIATNTSSINSDLNMTLSTTANSVDPSTNTVPAQTQQQQKTYSESVPATGKQNNGSKATGTVELSEPCSDLLSSVTIPAGTGISSNGLTFITQSSVTLVSYFNSCNQNNDNAASSTPVVAQQGGTQYNLNNATFTVSGYPNVTGSGSTSGGTDNIITIVQQSDIDSAEAKVKSDSSGNSNSIEQQLEQSLQGNGLYPVNATFKASSPSISPSSQAGTQASNVTVTETITYTMFGVPRNDLKTLIDDNVNQQIDTNKQAIQNDGLNQATFTAVSQSGSSAQVSMQATATVGPNLNVASLKKQIAGQKSGDIQSAIGTDPGVTNLNVHFSPFWVGSAPKSASKITVKFKSQNNANGG